MRLSESYNQQKKHIREREGGGRGESRGERGLAVDRETDRWPNIRPGETWLKEMTYPGCRPVAPCSHCGWSPTGEDSEGSTWRWGERTPTLGETIDVAVEYRQVSLLSHSPLNGPLRRDWRQRSALGRILCLPGDAIQSWLCVCFGLSSLGSAHGRWMRRESPGSEQEGPASWTHRPPQQTL